MIALCKFSQGGRRRNGWLKTTELPYLVSNLEKILDISSDDGDLEDVFINITKN